MAAPQNIIALIFDFDDTLTDDSTTQLLRYHGINPEDFWKKQVNNLVRNHGWDPTLAYLKLILDNVGDGKPFASLTNAQLREFGATLEFYQGIPELFDELRALVKQHRLSHPGIEFYVISGGLEEVIRGSSIAGHLEAFWGCCFDEEGGMIRYIKNVVSFTEKTKHLFEINKGLSLDKELRTRPYAVNEDKAEEDRRIPFQNMIYVGDGLTDVPCFSLLGKAKNKGIPFGVFNPEKSESPKQAWQRLVAPQRVKTLNSPKYRKTDDLGALIRVAVKELCLKMDVRTQTVPIE